MKKVRSYILEAAKFVSKKPGKFTKPASKKKTDKPPPEPEIDDSPSDGLPSDSEIRAALAKGMILVYGIAKGNVERYSEELLSSRAKTVAQVRQVFERASADGYHSFRVAGFREGTKPDFGRIINKQIPENLPHESTCAIHTVAFAINKTPEEVWGASREYWAEGRVKAGLTGNSIKKVLAKFGKGVIDRPEYNQKTFQRTYDLLDTIQNRPFIIGVVGHVLGVKNGEIKDTDRTPPRREVQFVLEVVDKEVADAHAPPPSDDPLKGKYVSGTAQSDNPDDTKSYTFKGIYLSKDRVFVQRLDKSGFDVMSLDNIQDLGKPAPQFLHRALRIAAKRSRR